MPIIALSGACNSGKTTFSQRLKDSYPDKVVVYDELIRGDNIKKMMTDEGCVNIDDLRHNPRLYYEVQLDIISTKIASELGVENVDKKLHVFDRSLIDSLFYFTFYVDKSMRSYEYYNIYENIHDMCKSNVYDKILMFKPLNSIESSIYRPRDIKNSQLFEYHMIRDLTYGICPDKVVEVEDIEETYKGLINEIQHL